jgi:hypothetical protein
VALIALLGDLAQSERTGLEPPGGATYYAAWFLSSLQQTFEGLPLWLQLLVVAVVVVALAQWTRGRYR